MDDFNRNNGEQIKASLRDYITHAFLPSARVDAFADTDSFLEKGILDSTGVLELLEYIEEKFEIRVEDHEIIPDNLDSLNKLSAFILRKAEDAAP